MGFTKQLLTSIFVIVYIRFSEHAPRASPVAHNFCTAINVQRPAYFLAQRTTLYAVAAYSGTGRDNRP